MSGERVYAVGEHVEVQHAASGHWIPGVITEVFTGPLSGTPVYVVGDYGYYACFVRPAPIPLRLLEAIR